MKKVFRSFLFVFVFFVSLHAGQLNAETPLPFPDVEPNISMDFQDANLKDILKVLSIQSGLNFISSEAVQDRKMTLYLDSVPLRKSMDRMFKANNLTYDFDKDSNTFIVKEWGKPEIETITKIFYLKFAIVSTSSIKEEMKGLPSADSNVQSDITSASSSSSSITLGAGGKWKQADDSGISAIVKKLLSQYGTVIEDYRTNSLIVTDIPTRIENISQVIASLDTPIPQVMLEVEMLDVSKNELDKIGVNWPATLASLSVSGTKVTSFPFNGQSTAQGTTVDGTGIGTLMKSPILADLPNWAANKFGPSIFTVLGTSLTFDFLKTLTDTKYLARPRIMTLNNETAEIKIVTDEAIGVKTSTNTTSTTGLQTVEAERAQTGISLRVTPQVNLEREEITMFIIPSVTEANNGGTFVFDTLGHTVTFKDPEIRATRSIVRVKDGETIVIGGLIRNQDYETVTKLPILGDIPFIGGAFRHKDKTKGIQRELLVFITPHIIKETLTSQANNALALAQNNKQADIPLREQNTVPTLDRQANISRYMESYEEK